MVALVAQPPSTRLRSVSMAFQTPSTLARIGLAWIRRCIRPSGRAHVVEYAVRIAVASTALPVLRASAPASDWLRGALFLVRGAAAS